ncbi:hypothetical protein BCR34DRAFT_189677 [Clohesyomyces aquaticus]|uniref:Uncharacterized protein n=1 Tax=Clohesyomyces aquaticus TaxID=1231657 RepID=A0A1Y1ZZD4_9PLEO|nr:hypothetical protein BCR34DRAFT_189677 [Clohesyomyces aquaticus]
MIFKVTTFRRFAMQLPLGWQPTRRVSDAQKTFCRNAIAALQFGYLQRCKQRGSPSAVRCRLSVGTAPSAHSRAAGFQACLAEFGSISFPSLSRSGNRQCGAEKILACGVDQRLQRHGHQRPRKCGHRFGQMLQVTSSGQTSSCRSCPTQGGSVHHVSKCNSPCLALVGATDLGDDT